MWFFKWTWFLFFNKLRWLFLFIYHVFCFNWISFFNKSICVNLYKFTFFIIPFFSLSTKQKREKLKKKFYSPTFSSFYNFLSSYFSTFLTKQNLNFKELLMKSYLKKNNLCVIILMFILIGVWLRVDQCFFYYYQTSMWFALDLGKSKAT